MNGFFPLTLFAVCGHESVIQKLSNMSLSVNRWCLSFGNTPWVQNADRALAPFALSTLPHSIRVPPDCTRSSTMTTCFPSGSPSFSVTSRLSPCRTLVQTTSSNPSKKVWNRFIAPSSG